MKNSKDLNEEGRKHWDHKAKFWNALHGEKGNQFHNQLVRPNVEKLLGEIDGKVILDVGCGNGIMARRLADLGGKVTAIDFSSRLIEMASSYQKYKDLIKYQVVDATNKTELLALGINRFDAIVSTMALMDMPEIFPLFSAASQILKPDGCLVFVSSHPSFNTNLPAISIESQDIDGQNVISYSMKVKYYLTPLVQKAMGAPNEPTPHNFYHRPLRMILGEAFKAGFVLDAFEESSFDISDSKKHDHLSWDNLTDIPQVIAGRFIIK